ncbi:MAG: tRNA lysidine(34) synthetase TilS [Bacteroidia bacterium]|nr:tRNA lysidine(34) synthetase TilS [Bacteroidia bacterium]
MLNEFQSHIHKSGLFKKEDKLLLAVSGGLDSTVLCHLLKLGGYQVVLAHCNFKLRGKDSEADEKFCKAIGKKLSFKTEVKHFDVKSYCKKHKVSVQVAARNLRYEWFAHLLKKEKLDYILTAHQANDSIETILLNLMRGTGINGIKGIQAKNGKIVRPLLPFTRREITEFAAKNKITFREDKSNSSDTYDRNFIRLHIIPRLKELNPKLENTFMDNAAHFAEEAGIVNDYLESRAAELLIQTHDSVFINKKKLKNEPYQSSLINFMISGYGFNTTQQKNILQNLNNNSISGKLFHSETHRLTIDRNDLVIKLNSEDHTKAVKINSLEDLKRIKTLRFSEESKFSVPAHNELLLDPSTLIFPLDFRPKKTGDKFKPFGMKGFKLVSDFLKDQKLNAFQKENCRLLVNGNGDIIWIAGYRSDERYKVDKSASSFLKLKFIES